MRGSFNFHRLILRIVRAWRITSIYRDPLNYYLRWRFVPRYKNNGNIPSFVFAPLSPYISRCQKMSERVVSGDRWRCGRSSNKARGINRNVGWFFIGGCFSRCRREGLSRPYRPTSLSVDFSALFAVPAILGDSLCNARKNTVLPRSSIILSDDVNMRPLFHAYIFLSRKHACSCERKNYHGFQLSKSLLMLV